MPVYTHCIYLQLITVRYVDTPLHTVNGSISA